MAGKGVNCCRIIVCFEMQKLEETLKSIAECCGDPSDLHNRCTLYKVETHAFSVRIDEAHGGRPDQHTISTLAGYKPTPEKRVFVQRAVRTQVTGDAHAFVRSLRYKPSHTWIERGYVFQYENIEIRVVRAFRFDGVDEVDPDNFAVTLESYADMTLVHTQNECRSLDALCSRLFGRDVVTENLAP